MEFATSLEKRRANGMLISGGCDSQGGVLFKPYHFEEMERIKKETGLSINLHTGLIPDGLIERISEIGVDAISFDVIGDDNTIRDVLHIDASVQDYQNVYEKFVRSGLKVIPHVLVGLNKGSYSGEREAVDLISRYQPEQTVMIIFIPTKGTPMAETEPPSISHIMDIASYMSSNLQSKLILGCMRPRIYDDLEIDLLDMSFSGIVSPKRSTLRYVRERKWAVTKHHSCCAAAAI